MPNFPIVDAHLHLWEPDRLRMPWLDELPQLNQSFDLAQYGEATRGLEVAAMVYLQVEVAPPYALLETQWVEERAQRDGRLQGIVPWAPLEYGERARYFLEALREISPRVKGIRRIIQFEPDDGFCLQSDFVRGVQILPEYDLSFDICIKGEAQFRNAIELVKRCPDTQFVLDHIGKPDIKDGVLDPWRAQMEQLASLPNTWCKISGLAVEADMDNWTVDDLKPYLEHSLSVFGEDRVLFGGDWPVVLQAAEYSRWVRTLDELSAHLSDEAKQKLWAENARRFYRLEGASL